MSKTRYFIKDQNITAFESMLESLEYQYADNATFQEALKLYRNKITIEPLINLLLDYDIQLGCLKVNIHDEIFEAKGNSISNISIFKNVPSPLILADDEKLTPEEVLKILQFN